MHIIDRSEDEFTIDIRGLCHLLLQKAWIVLLTCMLFILVQAVYIAVTFSPQYTANVTMYINNVSTADTGKMISTSDLSAAAKLVDTYAAIISSNTVLDEVARRANADNAADRSDPLITVTAINNTEVFRVSVTDNDAQRAVNYANAIADIVPTQIASIVEGSSVIVLDYAQIPEQASEPSYIKFLVIGVFLGVVVSVCGIIVWKLFDDKIYDERDLRHHGLAILGTVPKFEGAYGKIKAQRKDAKRIKKPELGRRGAKKKMLLTKDSPTVLREVYKSIRTNLIFAAPGDGCKKILITSPLQQEGKTITAVNLGVCFAESGANTLVVDCNLRRPAVASYTRTSQSPGLSHLLTGKCGLDQVITHLPNGMDLLNAGDPLPNPSEVLGSEKMRQLIRELALSYEYIIFDTPPICAVTDAAVLSREMSGVAFVIGYGVSSLDNVSDAIEKLKLSEADILGLIFNGVDVSEPGYRGYEYNF